MIRWAATLPRRFAHTAAALRNLGMEALLDTEVVWLRGSEVTEELGLALRLVPDLQRFDVSADGAITPHGLRIPVGRLPAGSWQPLSDLIKPKVQTAALPGISPPAVEIRLVRSDEERAPAALLVPFEVWATYAEHAPQVRLSPLRFACSPDGKALIMGTPLPPLPGQPLVDRHGVLTPAGYDWSPALEPIVLRRAMGLGEGDVALLRKDATYDLIRSDAFVQALRSAVRLTREGLGS